MGGRPDRHGESSPRPPRSGARCPPNRRSTIRSNRLALFRPYRCNRNLEPCRNRPRGPRHHLPGLPPSKTPSRRRFRSVNRRPLHDKKSSSSRGDWSPRYSSRLRSPANGCRPARLTAFPSASRPICGRTCGSLALRVGKSPQTLGNTSNPVDGDRSWVHPAFTPNTARGSGTGEPATEWDRSSGSGRRRRVETLGKPPRRVRGGPQPRWDRKGPAVRPPAQGCRGRTERRRAFGRGTGPSGRNPDRDRATAGHPDADGLSLIHI